MSAPEAVPVIYRLTRRDGSTFFVDEPELQRLRGLKRRTFVSAERARIHQCGACGKLDAWRDDWGWYGSIEQIDNWVGEEPVIPKWCSEPCRKQLVAERKVPGNARRLEGC